MFGDTPAPAAAPAPAVHEEDGVYTLQRTLAQNDSFDDVRIDIDRDSDFELTHLAGSWAQDLTINIFSPGMRPIASSQVKIGNCFGTRQFPVPLLRSMVFRRGSQLRIAITNLYAGSNAIELLFCGIKHFDAQ
jgi:hypothetical protein